MTHTSSTFAIEDGARVGDVLAATEGLLDDLEARGDLGHGEPVTRLRERIMQIARVRGAIWMQQPQAAASDLYAHVLAVPELAATRRRWDAELDARGAWLRPLRASELDPVVLAERRLDAGPGPLRGLCFEGEDAVAFEHRNTRGAHVWSWPCARVEQHPTHDPLPPLHSYDDPRFPRSDRGAVYQPTLSDEPRPLPWPDFGNASAKLSSDGRSIFVYGWVEDNDGLVLVVDPTTLEVTRRHALGSSVSNVVDRPGSDELLIATYDELAIVSPRGTRWRRSEGSNDVAWSPSGRYACVVAGEVVRLLDTHARARTAPQGEGLPVGFSPDGTRLVDGNALLDGIDGSPVATLDITPGRYLEGGPARPWYHVGIELIVCIRGGLALWDATSGTRVRAAGPLHVRHWEQIAFARSGRHFALNRRGEVMVAELPTLDTLGRLGFDIEIERIALSNEAELVAAYGLGVLEVRTREGGLVCRAETPAPREPRRHDGKLWFGADDRTIHIHEPAATTWSSRDGERHRPLLSGTWTLDGDRARWSDAPDPSLPPGWRVETGPFSRFQHDDGATLVVAARGPWVVNTVHPRLLACPGGLFELRP